jgi:hypothetical protein
MFSGLASAVNADADLKHVRISPARGRSGDSPELGAVVGRVGVVGLVSV